jgi:transcription elongation factor Elf1
MSEAKKIECDYTKEIVCLYCGEEQGDSWEISRHMSNGEQDTIECGNCGEK